jgi:hypothetical protein
MPKAEELKLIMFQKSTTSGKKYDALILDTKTKKIKKVSFGALGYEQYRDSTGLNIYSHLDHNDTKRRANYRKRHASNINVKWSPGWFSGKYLW